MRTTSLSIFAISILSTISANATCVGGCNYAASLGAGKMYSPRNLPAFASAIKFVLVKNKIYLINNRIKTGLQIFKNFAVFSICFFCSSLMSQAQ